MKIMENNLMFKLVISLVELFHNFELVTTGKLIYLINYYIQLNNSFFFEIILVDVEMFQLILELTVLNILSK